MTTVCGISTCIYTNEDIGQFIKYISVLNIIIKYFDEEQLLSDISEAKLLFGIILHFTLLPS